MTLQQIVEDVQGYFPDLNETTIMAEFNKVYKEFCQETRINSAAANLTLSPSTVSYALPSDVNEVYRIDMFYSSGQIIPEEDRPQWAIEHGYITFYSVEGEVITTFPSDVAVVKLNYYKTPTAITSITATIAIDTKYTDPIVSGILKKFYAKFPTIQTPLGDGKTIMNRDWQAVNYHKGVYLEGKIRAQREANTQKDGTVWNVALQDFSPTE